MAVCAYNIFVKTTTVLAGLCGEISTL